MKRKMVSPQAIKQTPRQPAVSAVLCIAAITLAACGGSSPKGLPVEMVQISGGTFTMGDDNGAYREEPAHTVTVGAFKIGKYEVTQAQYRAVTGKTPGYFSKNPVAGEVQENRPVEMVSWLDAVEFCNALSEKEGLGKVYTVNGSADGVAVTMDGSKSGYRLPTEAEWEYACRAGTLSGWSFGDNGSATGNYAWYHHDGIGNETHEVGKKKANPWGLYDMHGNVLEWCWDLYDSYQSGAGTDPQGAVSGSGRVARGGGWSSPSATDLRSAARNYFSPDYTAKNLGFRVVCN